MNLSIQITAEVSDAAVRDSILSLLDSALPYMADNVLVTSDLKED